MACLIAVSAQSHRMSLKCTSLLTNQDFCSNCTGTERVSANYNWWSAVALMVLAPVSFLFVCGG